MLRVVRVYSKPPGHEPDKTKPFVLPEGSTLMDFARTVHHDFENRMKFARVWGHGKFDGQRATKDYALADGDVTLDLPANAVPGDVLLTAAPTTNVPPGGPQVLPGSAWVASQATVRMSNSLLRSPLPSRNWIAAPVR